MTDINTQGQYLIKEILTDDPLGWKFRLSLYRDGTLTMLHPYMDEKNCDRDRSQYISRGYDDRTPAPETSGEEDAIENANPKA